MAEATPPADPATGQPAVEQQSDPKSGYDYEQDLLRNPSKAVQIAKQAQAEKDRIAGEHRQLRERVGNDLVSLVDQFGAPTLLRFLTHYGTLRNHPEFQPVAQALEQTGRIPPEIKLARARNGVVDDSVEDLREPWEKVADKLQEDLRRETQQLRQELRGVQAHTGIEKFQGHVKRFFSEEWPDLTDEDRTALDQTVRSRIQSYGSAPQGAAWMTNLTYDQVKQFIQGQMNRDMMRRAEDRARVRSSEEQRRAATDLPSSVRTTGREPASTPPQRVNTKDVLNAWIESEQATRR